MSELVTKDGKEIRRGQIRPALRTAIALIVEEGLTTAEAAERVGYQAESLYKALCKPHVRAYRAGVKRAWLEGETSQSWSRVVRLAKGAQSEKVQLEANRTILGAGGELQPETAAEPDARPIILIKNEMHNHGPLVHEVRPGVWQAADDVAEALPGVLTVRDAG